MSGAGISFRLLQRRTGRSPIWSDSFCQNRVEDLRKTIARRTLSLDSTLAPGPHRIGGLSS